MEQLADTEPGSHVAVPEVVNSQPSKSNKLERELTEPAATSSTIKLKYVYQKDQWSPINPNGKKRYDRRFLLSIQPDCINLKPKGLPDVPDIIMEKPKPCPLRTPKPFTHPHSGDRGSKATKEAPRKENDLQLRPVDREGHAVERDVRPKVRATGIQGLSKGSVTQTAGEMKGDVKEEDIKPQSKKKEQDKAGNQEDVSKEGETLVQSEGTNNGVCNGLQDVVKEPPAKEPISEEVFRERCREAITGYMQLRNPQIMISFLEDAQCPQFHHHLIMLAMRSAINGPRVRTEAIGRLLQALCKEERISLECVSEGFSEFVSSFQNGRTTSNEAFWRNLGEIFAGMVLEGLPSLEFMMDALQAIPGKENSLRLVTEIIKATIELSSVYKALRLWQNSNFYWGLFADEGFNVKQHVRNEKLEFTLPLEERRASLNPKPKMEKKQAHEEIPACQGNRKNRIAAFQNDLIALLKTNHVQHKDVFKFIENSVDEDMKATSEFIRALVLAVCFSTVIDGPAGPGSKCERVLLERRSVLIKRYLKENKDFEMETLLVVQALYASLGNPPGLLRVMFEVLYDEEVVSEDTFYSWQEDEDVSESCKQAASNFFDWLDEQ